jgi:hypothetical protein
MRLAYRWGSGNSSQATPHAVTLACLAVYWKFSISSSSIAESGIRHFFPATVREEVITTDPRNWNQRWFGFPQVRQLLYLNRFSTSLESTPWSYHPSSCSAVPFSRSIYYPLFPLLSCFLVFLLTCYEGLWSFTSADWENVFGFFSSSDLQ